MTHPTHAHAFKEGVMWECDEWYIDTDHLCTSFGGQNIVPCKHSHSERTDGRERKWIVPRIVIAYNEGGYDSTGICLDCILEQAAAIEVTE